jgi:hypothetical protein
MNVIKNSMHLLNSLEVLEVNIEQSLVGIVRCLIVICDIDFFNFRNCQVQNFEILNHFKRDQNFAVNF